MGLFSFLRSSQPSYTDKVWKTGEFCVKGLMTDALHEVKSHQVPVIAAFFKEGQQRLVDFLNGHQIPYHHIHSSNLHEASRATEVIVLIDSACMRPGDIGQVITHLPATTKKISILGHYPLPTKESAVMEKILLSRTFEIIFYSALDDACLKLFNGQRILELMEKLGMKDEEPIEHSMVAKSMERARNKIQAQVKFEKEADSEETWFAKNVPNL